MLVERGDGAKGYHAYNCLMHALDLRELPKELMDMEERRVYALPERDSTRQAPFTMATPSGSCLSLDCPSEF